jgi:hypothetical protein
MDVEIVNKKHKSGRWNERPKETTTVEAAQRKNAQKDNPQTSVTVFTNHKQLQT